jgi:signal transduction histidine kinase/CheY-like chemotaxis protein
MADSSILCACIRQFIGDQHSSAEILQPLLAFVADQTQSDFALIGERLQIFDETDSPLCEQFISYRYLGVHGLASDTPLNLFDYSHTLRLHPMIKVIETGQIYLDNEIKPHTRTDWPIGHPVISKAIFLPLYDRSIPHKPILIGTLGLGRSATQPDYDLTSTSTSTSASAAAPPTSAAPFAAHLDICELVLLLILQKQRRESIYSTFLDQLSKAIRLPLSGIISTCRNLDPATPLINERLVRTLNACSFELLQTVNDLLDYNRMTTAQLTLHPEVISIHRILDTVRQMINSRLNKDVQFRLSWPDHWPDLYIADELRLIQIFVTLLDISVKATQRGTIDLSIVNGPAAREVRHLQCRIIDSGPGLNENQVHAINQCLSQREPLFLETNGRITGLGLGLLIVNYLIGLYGGRLSVLSLFDPTIVSLPTKVPLTRTSQLPLSPPPLAVANTRDEGIALEFNLTLPIFQPLSLVTAQDTLKRYRNGMALVICPDSPDRTLLCATLAQFNIHPIITTNLTDLQSRQTNIHFVFIDRAFLLQEPIQARIQTLNQCLTGQTRIIILDRPKVIGDGLGLTPPSAMPVPLEYSFLLFRPVTKEQIVSVLCAVATNERESSRRLPTVPASMQPLLVAELNNELAPLLHILGYRTVVVTTADQLAQVLQQRGQPYRLLFLDFTQPELSVTTLLRRYRDHIRVPVVAITAQLTPSEREKYFRQGVIGYIAKPIQMEHLERLTGRITSL